MDVGAFPAGPGVLVAPVFTGPTSGPGADLAGLERADDGTLQTQQGTRRIYVPQEPLFDAQTAVFDIVANDEFLAHVRTMGERLRSALEQMIPNHDGLFEDVRGMLKDVPLDSDEQR